MNPSPQSPVRTFLRFAVREENATSAAASVGGSVGESSGRAMEIASHSDGYAVRVDGHEHHVTWRDRTDGRVQVSIGGRSVTASVVRLDAGRWLVEWKGITRIYTVEDELAARTSRAHGARGAAAGGPATLAAPMPGTVVQVLTTEGQTVAAGEALFIIEAMKMQNEIAAPIGGRVTKLNVTPGQSVESRHPLCVITP